MEQGLLIAGKCRIDIDMDLQNIVVCLYLSLEKQIASRLELH